MARERYPSDLSDEQWCLIEPLVLSGIKGRTGRPPKHSRREVVNALLYMARTGCSYRHLPHDLPHWSIVWDSFRRWRDNGKLEQLHHLLREQVRVEEGHEAHPSAVILDSQSVKAAKGGNAVSTPGRK